MEKSISRRKMTPENNHTGKNRSDALFPLSLSPSPRPQTSLQIPLNRNIKSILKELITGGFVCVQQMYVNTLVEFNAAKQFGIFDTGLPSFAETKIDCNPMLLHKNNGLIPRQASSPLLNIPKCRALFRRTV